MPKFGYSLNTHVFSLMGTKPPHECCYPACRVLTTKRFCPKHTAQKSELNKLYTKRRWRKFREAYLNAHPLCMCKGYGCEHAPGQCGSMSTEPDHIKRRSEGGEDFDEKNLQALCKPCHSRKTHSETLGNKF